MEVSAKFYNQHIFIFGATDLPNMPKMAFRKAILPWIFFECLEPFQANI